MIVEVESLCVQDTENAFVLILSVNTRNSAVTTFQVLKEMLMSNNWPPIYLMLNGDIFSQFSNKFPSTCSSVDALDHRIYFWNSKVTRTFIIYVWGMRNNENAEQFAGCFLIFSNICFKIIDGTEKHTFSVWKIQHQQQMLVLFNSAEKLCVASLCRCPIFVLFIRCFINCATLKLKLKKLPRRYNI